MESSARDALRGLSIGDAFGETFFFPDRVHETPWPWTDDTAMALALFAVLRAHGRVDQDALAAEFASTYAADPYRNYGASMHDVLAAIGAGEPWRDVTGRQFDGQGSWGNGAAMRVAPLGAWFAGDPPPSAAGFDGILVSPRADGEAVQAKPCTSRAEGLRREISVVEQAALSAAVTHAHPEAAAGAIAVAVAAYLNVVGSWDVAAVADHVPAGAVRDGLLTAASLPATTSATDAAALLGSGQRISAPDTVPFAVWCAATRPDDLVRALRFTATGGGDVDTTCAMVGGIVAARTGVAAVPADWHPEPLPAWVDR